MANLKRIVVSGGGSGGYETIEEDGSALPQENTLNFVGASAVITDNPGVATNVTFASNLNTIAGLTPSANSIIAGNGTAYYEYTPTDTTDYFVASNGSDSNNGSMLFPFATIQHAINTAGTANANIIVMGGTYTENLTISGTQSGLVILGWGNQDYSNTNLEGTITLSSGANNILFQNLEIYYTGGTIVTLPAVGEIFFLQCRIDTGGTTNTAVSVTGASTGEIRFRSCYINGIVSNAATTFYTLWVIQQQSSECCFNISDGDTIIIECPQIGSVTHSGGAVELWNIQLVNTTGGVTISSTANLSATNVLYLQTVNLQQPSGSYGTLSQTGTCYYLIGNSNYSPSTTFSGTRLNYLNLANDVNANYTPVHYTAVNPSVEGNLNGIDNALANVASAFKWTVETSNITLTKNNGYFANSSSALTFALPTTAAVGDTFSIASMDTGLFTISQSAGQYIRFGGDLTTTGTGGYIQNTSIGDAITLVCNVANVGFIVTPGTIGNFNVN